MKEQELLKRIAGLPREIRPRHDAWDRISERLDEVENPVGPEAGRHRRWLPGWPVRAVAAAAVLAVVVVSLTGGPEPIDREPALSQVAEPAAVTPRLLAGSETEYQAAFREFIAIGDSRDQIPAPTVEKIETGWADLRQVETALVGALAQNPDDPFLNKRMLELRARQLGFLRQLASLEHSNRRLTI